MVKPTTGIFQNKVKYIKGTVWCLKKLGDKFLSDISRKEKISNIILILALVRQPFLFYQTGIIVRDPSKCFVNPISVLQCKED